MKRILILMSDTGGGHRASAEALQAVFQERYSEQIQVDIIDLWTDHTPWPLNQLPQSYRFIISHAPWLWKLAWRISENQQARDPLFKAIAQWTYGSVRRAFLRYQPDLIISVHPLMQHVPLLILKKMGWAKPFVTVVTDLTTANMNWFHPGVDRCFVASDEAYRRGLAAGLAPHKLRMLGLPIRPSFARQTQPKDELRRKLGLQVNVPTILLVSGGEGMGPVLPIANSVVTQLSQAGIAGQLVVICGRNTKLQKRLKRERWALPVHVRGFVTNMPEWMAASDCIITKAGPGTIAEALISGLPIMLSGFIPGQEEGNVPFVIENGVGAYSEDPTEIGRTITRWLGSEHAVMTEMARRAKSLGRPQSTYDIVEEIAGLVLAEEQVG
jgi:1,2-diacylglycerol 3-beta-galactosyltransferase